MTERSKRKVVVGLVTSDKMQKTVAVRVEQLVKHPRYGKYVRQHTTFKAHDEKREARIGDLVEIMETRPLSRTKTWRLVRIVKKGEGVLTPIAGAPDLEALQKPEAPKKSETPKAEAPPAQGTPQ